MTIETLIYRGATARREQITSEQADAIEHARALFGLLHWHRSDSGHIYTQLSVGPTIHMYVREDGSTHVKAA